MNYLELINKCLLELNYKQVNAFSELIKNDHKRIKGILNVVNQEICNAENWNFLLRRTQLIIPKGSVEIENTIEGKILYIFIDGKKYNFVEDVEKFIAGNVHTQIYSSMDNKLLFPKFDTEKTADIVYYTRKSAIDENNIEKTEMTQSTDKSLIPKPFAEQLLVYGTCLRLKANPQYFKFSYWMGMYQEALRNLKTKSSASVLNAPSVNVFRR